jgi:hypothetical protein
MYKYIIAICVITFCLKSSQAQNLLFVNKAQNKTITVKVGAKLFLGYRGYNGNTEFATNTVYEITDSTITFGINPEYMPFKRKPSAATNQYKIVRLKDITHFRKRSLGGQLTKDLLRTGAAIGSVFLLSDLYRNSNISRGNAFLISLGVGVATNLGIKLMFPENAKHAISDGWQIVVQY